MNRYDLKIDFFTDARLTELFGYFGSLVKFAAPVALISVAMSMVGLVLMIVVRLFRKGTGIDDDRDKDRDYDIKYYD